MVEIKDDERRLFFAVLLHALGEFLVAVDELNLYVQLTRRFLNLGGEEQVVDESKDAGVGVLACRQGLRLGLRILCGKAGAASARPMAVVAGHHSTIAVIHGRGINPVLILSLAAGAGALATMVGWTATAPPSSSSSATGGSSWSCVHSPLKLPCGVPPCQTSKKSPHGVCF